MIFKLLWLLHNIWLQFFIYSTIKLLSPQNSLFKICFNYPALQASYVFEKGVKGLLTKQTDANWKGLYIERCFWNIFLKMIKTFISLPGNKCYFNCFITQYFLACSLAILMYFLLDPRIKAIFTSTFIGAMQVSNTSFLFFSPMPQWEHCISKSASLKQKT